jgi:hypothetical protein
MRQGGRELREVRGIGDGARLRGCSGTGKTLAAEVFASEFRLDS